MIFEIHNQDDLVKQIIIFIVITDMLSFVICVLLVATQRSNHHKDYIMTYYKVPDQNIPTLVPTLVPIIIIYVINSIINIVILFFAIWTVIDEKRVFHHLFYFSISSCIINFITVFLIRWTRSSLKDHNQRSGYLTHLQVI
jgi:hypothetical protein